MKFEIILFILLGKFSNLYCKLYELKKCRGGGCPYAASWLLDINFYFNIHWYLWSTKMEEASFRVFQQPYIKYQLEDPNAFFCTSS